MKFEHRHDPSVIYYRVYRDDKAPGGYFDPGRPDNIFLSQDIKPMCRECIYWHEDKHRQCFKNKCFCFDMKTDFWAEYHALKYEFEKVLASGNKQLQNVYWRSTKQFVKIVKAYKREYPTHLAALQRLGRTRKFRQFAKERGGLWMGYTWIG